MTPIKVFHIIHVQVEAPSLSILCDHIDPAEVEFSFVTFAKSAGFVESMERRGKTVYALNANKRRDYPFVLRKLWAMIKREDPDIVHTHTFNPTLIGLTMAKWQNRRTVLTRHHSDAHHELVSPLKRKFYLGLENYINHRADHIIAPAKAVYDILVEKENVPREKVSLVSYGLAKERFDIVTPEKIAAVRAELGMDGDLALVCVSRLFHRKGHKYLFEAFSALLKKGLRATLYLVGTGDHKNALEALAAELGISERVRFLGWRTDALAIIGAADIIAHPSLEDALSQSLIESLMMGRPVVASDISGVRDTLGEGKYGRIVPPADSEAFRAGLESVINDLEAARRTAEAGKAYLIDHMDPKRVAEKHVTIYRNLLKSN